LFLREREKENGSFFLFDLSFYEDDEKKERVFEYSMK